SCQVTGLSGRATVPPPCHTSPKRLRGDTVVPSLALRAGVNSTLVLRSWPPRSSGGCRALSCTFPAPGARPCSPTPECPGDTAPATGACRDRLFPRAAALPALPERATATPERPTPAPCLGRKER